MAQLTMSAVAAATRSWYPLVISATMRAVAEGALAAAPNTATLPRMTNTGYRIASPHKHLTEYGHDAENDKHGDAWPNTLTRKPPKRLRLGLPEVKKRVWILSVRNAVVREDYCRACCPEWAGHCLSLKPGRPARHCTWIQQWREVALSLGFRCKDRCVTRTAKCEEGLTVVCCQECCREYRQQ
jgi:hypothetical protein